MYNFDELILDDEVGDSLLDAEFVLINNKRVKKTHHIPINIYVREDFIFVDYMAPSYLGSYPCSSDIEVVEAINFIKAKILSNKDIPLIVDKRIMYKDKYSFFG